MVKTSRSRGLGDRSRCGTQTGCTVEKAIKGVEASKPVEKAATDKEMGEGVILRVRRQNEPEERCGLS